MTLLCDLVSPHQPQRSWKHKTFASGSVVDRPRSRRRRRPRSTCAAVGASIEHSPMKSTRKQSAELDIPQTKMQDRTCKDLKAKCYWPLSVNELTENDPENQWSCVRACFNAFGCRDKDNEMFSDECTIYRSSCNCNVYLWSKNNPNFYEK